MNLYNSSSMMDQHPMHPHTFQPLLPNGNGASPPWQGMNMGPMPSTPTPPTGRASSTAPAAAAGSALAAATNASSRPLSGSPQVEGESGIPQPQGSATQTAGSSSAAAASSSGARPLVNPDGSPFNYQ